MFSQESKLAVLESKLNIYEDLSREMLAKLEAAVDKISEGNNRIAMILAKHDERIDQSIKSDALIIKMIEDMKEENKEDHARVRNRIDKLELSVEELKKFKWQMGGIAAIAVVIVGILPHFIDRILPSHYNGSTQIQNTKR
jgi:hypothetical protein